MSVWSVSVSRWFYSASVAGQLQRAPSLHELAARARRVGFGDLAGSVVRSSHCGYTGFLEHRATLLNFSINKPTEAIGMVMFKYIP